MTNKEKIAKLQSTETETIEEKNEVNKQIEKILRKCSTDEIREMLNGTKVHSICIQKGGVGKTTTTANIGFTLAKMGFKVLVIDGDPQASLSYVCNMDPEKGADMPGLENLYYAYFDERDLARKEFREERPLPEEEFDNVIIQPIYQKPARNEKGRYVPTPFKMGFDFIPSTIYLADLDLQLAQYAEGNVWALDKILTTLLTYKHYDFVLIDNLPGLNALSYTSIVASHSGGVIVPVNLEPMTVVGATNLFSVVADIQKQFQQRGLIHKGITCILTNQYSPRQTIQKKYEDVVKEFFPVQMLNTSVPRKASCNKAHDSNRLFAEFDPEVGDIFDDICFEILAEDVRRAEEKEIKIIDEFGEDIYNKIYNKMKG